MVWYLTRRRNDKRPDVVAASLSKRLGKHGLPGACHFGRVWRRRARGYIHSNCCCLSLREVISLPLHSMNCSLRMPRYVVNL
ncbi:hypothetical protein KCU98_g52, partial [Aureobasidium melanogenum]